jgi:hypothetical protein
LVGPANADTVPEVIPVPLEVEDALDDAAGSEADVVIGI